MKLDPDHLREFASRDWGAVDRLSRRSRAAMGLADRVRIAVELYEAARLTLAALASDPDTYVHLPAPLQDALDQRHRIPDSSRWHQMFGHGSAVQDAVSAHESDHLLLQLHSDYMMHWMWGDVGVIQFWISPENLAGQRWDRVEMTIDSH